MGTENQIELLILRHSHNTRPPCPRRDMMYSPQRNISHDIGRRTLRDVPVVACARLTPCSGRFDERRLRWNLKRDSYNIKEWNSS